MLFSCRETLIVIVFVPIEREIGFDAVPERTVLSFTLIIPVLVGVRVIVEAELLTDTLYVAVVELKVGDNVPDDKVRAERYILGFVISACLF